MAFHEVQFPSGISYGARGGPGFNTAIIEKDSGQEERISRWAAMRHSYDVSHGIRNPNDAAAVLDFHVARSGAAHGFRYKDWSDWTTAANHVAPPSFLDEQIGVGDGLTTQFQLLTTYLSGGTTVTRTIKKPVAGTTLMGVAGAQVTTGWTVNTTTGIVTFTVAPTTGQILTAGCEFDVPVRFGDDVDRQLPMTIEAFEQTSIPSIMLVELMDEAPIDEDFWFGGGSALGAVSANVTITVGNGRTLTILPSVGGLKIFLPNPTALPAGGPYFYIVNQSAAASILLRNHLDAAVATIAALAMMTVVLTVDAGGNKVWLGA